MPGMRGWQVATRCGRCRTCEHLKIVIVSANAHEFAPGGAGTAHDAFLIKPIDMQRMLECLGRELHLRWTSSKPAPRPAREIDLQGALPEHSRHHVDDLYQLGLIGHVRGIQAKLREMETDPTNKPFATRMRTLVANFDLKRYMNVLEGMTQTWLTTDSHTSRDTILVVDDTPETLGFLTDTLDHAGFTALIATDGESALRLIEQITPDLVLMDAVMPGLNGFETCRRMKRNKMFAALPVIFMTGSPKPRTCSKAWRPAAWTT